MTYMYNGLREARTSTGFCKCVHNWNAWFSSLVFSIASSPSLDKVFRIIETLGKSGCKHSGMYLNERKSMKYQPKIFRFRQSYVILLKLKHTSVIIRRLSLASFT